MKKPLSADKAHIALFVPSLRGGGAERIMLLLANHFAKAGHKIDLVLLRCEGPYLEDVSDDVRIIDLAVSKARYAFLPLLRYLRRERPAAVLSTLSHLNIMVALALALSRVSSRLILREANMLNPENKRDAANSLFRWAYSWAYRRADSVVGISYGVSQDITHATGRNNVVTIHNPIDIETVQGKGWAPVEHPWFDETIPIVISVGRLVQQKDFATLIKAFAEMRQTREARLVILGEGPERPALEQFVKDLDLESCVWMPGFMTNPFRYLSRSSLFVLSSRWEGFGNVLVEAMACGTPVVSTDCPSGPSEILEGGKWGRLVPVGDHEALATAMLETLNEDRLDTSQSRTKEFSVEKVARAYLALLGISPNGARI